MKTKASSKLTAADLDVVTRIQAERGISRKSAIRYFQKNRSLFTLKGTKPAPAVDFKSAAANDKAETKSETKTPSKTKIPAAPAKVLTPKSAGRRGRRACGCTSWPANHHTLTSAKSTARRVLLGLGKPAPRLLV